MISIVVLALGLLGVAAVFPAVLSQQRQATDSVMGASAESSVEKVLKENAIFNRPSRVNVATDSVAIYTDARNQRGWRLLTSNRNWSKANAGLSQYLYFDGDWSPTNDGPAAGQAPIAMDAAGNMQITGLAGPQTATASDNTRPQEPTFFTIPLIQRLNPTPYSSGAQPQYVWDFAARRISAGVRPSASVSADVSSFDDQVQVVVFIRRIDTAIRKPMGRTLSDVLTGNYLASPTTEMRVPVAVDNRGRPTFDGLGSTTTPAYSTIQWIEYAVATGANNTVFPDRIVIDPSSTKATIAPYAKVVGQKLVDSFGVIHTVQELMLDPTTQQVASIRIAPAMDMDKYGMWAAGAGSTARMLFTPQVPAAVEIVNIQPSEPSIN